MNFSFKREKEIKIDFSAEKICVLKDKIVLYSKGSMYFINEYGEIIFSIPALGFEKGRVSEFFDFTGNGNNIFILGKNKITRYNSYGEFLNEFPVNLPSPLFIDVVFPFGIFVFDKDLFKVERYDFDGEKKGEFFIKTREIEDMDVDENYVYFLNNDGKVIFYNFYGNKAGELELISGKKIEVSEELIFILDEKNLYVFDRDKKIYCEGLSAKDIYLKDEKLYILSENIEIRRFEK